MQWESVEQLESHVRNSIVSDLRYCFGSSAQELQIESQLRSFELLKAIQEYRQHAIDANDSGRANAAFVQLTLMSALIHHLQTWLMLKTGQIDDAWNELVETQECLECALRFVKDEFLTAWQRQVLSLEKVAFPPQVFVSVSHTFKSANCSICGFEYGECEHLSGQLYMGSICVAQLHELGEANHVAIVKNPRDKGCRRIKVKNNGYMQCTLTLRNTEIAGDERGDAEICLLRAR